MFYDKVNGEFEHLLTEFLSFGAIFVDFILGILLLCSIAYYMRFELNSFLPLEFSGIWGPNSSSFLCIALSEVIIAKIREVLSLSLSLFSFSSRSY